MLSKFRAFHKQLISRLTWTVASRVRRGAQHPGLPVCEWWGWAWSLPCVVAAEFGMGGASGKIKKPKMSVQLPEREAQRTS